ncbi:MAG TPA: hypothetical protein PKD00_00685 [Burkholderiales bacterium]|nr:hypothetical protein [Burkholderiales bacterium]
MISDTAAISVLEEINEIINTPKQTSEEELLAEAKVMKLLVDGLKVPFDYLRESVVNVDVEPTEFFTEKASDGSRINVLEPKVLGLAERIVGALRLSPRAFRDKDSAKVIAEKLLSIQKTVPHTNKSKLEKLFKDLEFQVSQIESKRSQLGKFYQKMIETETKRKELSSKLQKKSTTLNSFEEAVKNPDTLQSVSEYMNSKIPSYKSEVRTLSEELQKIKAEGNVYASAIVETQLMLKDQKDQLLEKLNKNQQDYG